MAVARSMISPPHDVIEIRRPRPVNGGRRRNRPVRWQGNRRIAGYTDRRRAGIGAGEVIGFKARIRSGPRRDIEAALLVEEEGAVHAVGSEPGGTVALVARPPQTHSAPPTP